MLHYTKLHCVTELWHSLMVAMHHCHIWPTLSQHDHLTFLHIRSTYVLVTEHIHPTLQHLYFDPSTSQEGWVFIYETSLIQTWYMAVMLA